jgi:hypothetical protein
MCIFKSLSTYIIGSMIIPWRHRFIYKQRDRLNFKTIVGGGRRRYYVAHQMPHTRVVM